MYEARSSSPAALVAARRNLVRKRDRRFGGGFNESLGLGLDSSERWLVLGGEDVLLILLWGCVAASLDLTMCSLRRRSALGGDGVLLMMP